MTWKRQWRRWWVFWTVHNCPLCVVNSSEHRYHLQWLWKRKRQSGWWVHWTNCPWFFMFLNFCDKIRSPENLVSKMHTPDFFFPTENPFIHKKINFLLLKSWKNRPGLFFFHVVDDTIFWRAGSFVDKLGVLVHCHRKNDCAESLDCFHQLKVTVIIQVLQKTKKERKGKRLKTISYFLNCWTLYPSPQQAKVKIFHYGILLFIAHFCAKALSVGL